MQNCAKPQQIRFQILQSIISAKDERPNEIQQILHTRIINIPAIQPISDILLLIQINNFVGNKSEHIKRMWENGKLMFLNIHYKKDAVILRLITCIN